MDDVNARYNPSFNLMDNEDVDKVLPLQQLEPKYHKFRRQLKAFEAARIHVGRDGGVAGVVANPARWTEMVDAQEHARLNSALMELKWRQQQDRIDY